MHCGGRGGGSSLSIAGASLRAQQGSPELSATCTSLYTQLSVFLSFSCLPAGPLLKRTGLAE